MSSTIPPPAVQRALAYPFDPPQTAFVFEDGTARAYDPTTDAPLLAGRLPILAVGSNASPQRLAEKFGPQACVPVTEAVVGDYVVAHSAKFAGYGAIPATLHPWPGARMRLHATWLTPDQRAIMDDTETLGVAYDRCAIHPVTWRDAAAAAAASAGVVEVETYISRAGAFGVDGRPAVSAAARVETPEPASVFDQFAIQSRAMAVLRSGADLTAFIAENVADDAVRSARSSQLSALVGLPFR